jgi:lipoyl-dependent peroxiredoxin
MNDGLKILYTAEATAVGGREGHGRTSDGRVDVALDVPREMGGSGGPGTNPEQLFAVGYAACFHSALKVVGRRRGADVDGSEVSASVSIGARPDGGFGLAVELDVHLPALDRETAEAVAADAHQVCPYSNATRGNIEVKLAVV